MFEGYGQTECTAGCTLTLPGDSTTGHVGPPLPNTMIKLVDVADMNYFTSNNEGEVSGAILGGAGWSVQDRILVLCRMTHLPLTVSQYVLHSGYARDSCTYDRALKNLLTSFNFACSLAPYTKH